DLDQQIGQRLVDYRRLELRRLLYRDRDSARLEYTWTALPKDTEFPGPYRAIDQMYLARDGVEYALYMAGPAEDWDTTRAQFETVVKGWGERGRQRTGPHPAGRGQGTSRPPQLPPPLSASVPHRVRHLRRAHAPGTGVP